MAVLPNVLPTTRAHPLTLFARGPWNPRAGHGTISKRRREGQRFLKKFGPVQLSRAGALWLPTKSSARFQPTAQSLAGRPGSYDVAIC